MFKNKPSIIFSNKGFTLVELLITIAVIGIGVSAALVALQQGIGTISYAKSRLTAVFLAQEGIEVVKNIRDTNFLESHYGASAVTWNEGLPTGDFEVQYTDPQTTNPTLNPLPCSPSCTANDSSLRFLKKQNKSFYNYNSGDITKYKRKINIKQISSDQIEIESTVYWKKQQDGFGQVSIVQEMYKWW